MAMTDLAKTLMELAPDRVVVLDGGARRCRVCGCTQEHACVDPEHGACWWIEADLCSHCGEPAIVAAEYDCMLSDGGYTPDELWLWTQKARAALGRVTKTDATAFEP